MTAATPSQDMSPALRSALQARKATKRLSAAVARFDEIRVERILGTLRDMRHIYD